MNINFSRSSIKDDSECVNIAIPPCYQANFIKDKTPFINSNSYFGRDGHQMVHQFTDEFIKNLKDKLIYKDLYEVNVSYKNTLIFHVKFLIQYLAIHLYIIDKAVRKHKPKKIFFDQSFCFENDNEIINNQNGYFIHYLLDKYITANRLDIEIINIGAKRSYRKFNFFSKNIFNKLITVIFLNRSRKLRDRKVVIVAEDSYNMAHLVDLLRKNDPTIYPIYLNIQSYNFLKHLKNIFTGKGLFFLLDNIPHKPSINLRKYLENITENIALHNKPNLNFLQVDLSDIFVENLRSNIFKKLHSLEFSVEKIDELISVCKPYLIISQHALGYSSALGELSKLKSLNSMLISHGTLSSLNHNNPARTEWLIHSNTLFNGPYMYSAIQSPQENHFHDNLESKLTKKLITGPLLISTQLKSSNDLAFLKQKLLGSKAKKMRIIMHAGTPKSFNCFRPLIYESNDEYVKNINDLISSVEQIENVFLVIRYRPTLNLDVNSFKSLIKKSRNSAIYIDGDFSDFLSITDVLVSYSSTTIDQAIHNRKAVLQYDCDNKYMHYDGVDLTKENFKIAPVYYCGKKESLPSSLKIIIENLDQIYQKRELWDSLYYKFDQSLRWLGNIKKHD